MRPAGSRDGADRDEYEPRGRAARRVGAGGGTIHLGSGATALGCVDDAHAILRDVILEYVGDRAGFEGSTVLEVNGVAGVAHARADA